MLNDVKLRSIKATGKIQKFTDAKGLYLYVSSAGGKVWRYDYTFDGKRKTYTIGAYPTVPLGEARKAHAELKSLLSQGIDPQVQKQSLKAAVIAKTENAFEMVAREYITKQKKQYTTKHLQKVTVRLENYIFPLVGKIEISDITPPQLLACIHKIEALGYHETAHCVLNTCGQVFRYGIATGRCERNAAADLKGALVPVVSKNFPSITDPKELGILLRDIDEYTGNDIVRTALQIAPYVFVRPSELRCAKWAEFDLAKAEWRIPAERMKMRQLHIVPLAIQVLGRLIELHQLTGHTEFLFPSMRATTAPISDATLLAGLRRMGYTKEQIVPHGFRHTASTLLNEQGYNRDWIERQLAHSERNSVRGTYNHAEYLPERKKMMQEWADYLDSLRAQSVK